jgi:hypothetical protein
MIAACQGWDPLGSLDEVRSEPGALPEPSRLGARAAQRADDVVHTGGLLGEHPMEPMTGIEPAYSAWEADVLPLNYIGAHDIGRP